MPLSDEDKQAILKQNQEETARRTNGQTILKQRIRELKERRAITCGVNGDIPGKYTIQRKFLGIFPHNVWVQELWNHEFRPVPIGPGSKEGKYFGPEPQYWIGDEDYIDLRRIVDRHDMGWYDEECWKCGATRSIYHGTDY